MNEEDEDAIYEGDIVEHRMNTLVFGMAIGFEGSLVLVRVSPSLATMKFHQWELRKVSDDDEYRGEEGEPVEDDNVVDFTKVRDLRTAKAKGTA